MTPSVRWLALSLVVLAACSRGSANPNDAGVEPHGSAGDGAAAAGGSAATGAGAGGTGASGDTGSGGLIELPALANDTSNGVFVHLFEWRWSDIARECESFLGPRGFTAVQISPPSEHAVLAVSSYPWWQRYQTVSYALESRSGTRAELIDMLARCRQAGVGIYVDAVLNHMTGQSSGTGSAGTKFTKYSYPGLFEQADFHAPVCQIQGADYAESADRVQSCELLGLSDLDTSSESVQSKLAAYLSELLALGVRGFRIDAAKHMAPADLAGVLAKVTPRPDEPPYYFLEVIDHGGEAVHSSDYLAVASEVEVDVTEFRYKWVGDAFLGRGGVELATLAQLETTTSDFLSSERAVVFIDNHDTQRGDSLFYQDGAAYDLATVFMLAWPYGYPSVMSSFGFDRDTDAGRALGPPSSQPGQTDAIYAPGSAEPTCAVGPFDRATRGFICEHRQRHVAAMVTFRKETAGAAVSNVWHNDGNQLAFAREGRGFVAINHEAVALEQTLATSLPAGRYCDVVSGDYVPGVGTDPPSCTGQVIMVASDGSAALVVPPDAAVVLHVGSRL